MPDPPSRLSLEVIRKKTILGHLREFLPECYQAQKDNQRLPTAVYFHEEGMCGRGSVCVPALARRARIIFNTFKDAKLLVLLFRRRGVPNQFAVVIPRSYDLRVVRCNVSGLALVRGKAKKLLANIPSGF